MRIFFISGSSFLNASVRALLRFEIEEVCSFFASIVVKRRASSESDRNGICLRFAHHHDLFLLLGRKHCSTKSALVTLAHICSFSLAEKKTSDFDNMRKCNKYIILLNPN